jgi:dephospho-CoA kinase
MMLVIGLTGSIGMGKSTLAGMFRTFGIAVHDSDLAVHQLYKGKAKEVIGKEFPGSVLNAEIDRTELSKIVMTDHSALKRLESIVHPMVEEHRQDFLLAESIRGARMAVCDVPLLFEKNMDPSFNVIVLATAKFETQKTRVLARDRMTEDLFQTIIAKQIPDLEKRKRAHYLVDTERGLDFSFRQIKSFIQCCATRANN